MIEEGIAKLVQSDPTVLALCPTGGFYSTLPKGQPLPSWSYIVVSEVTQYTLIARTDLTERRLQIDMYGMKGADVLNLARAIDNVLSGYRGTLTDPDATVVQGCFRSNELDFFDADSRTYRRMLEYELQYNNLG